MADVLAAVDSVTGAFGALVQNRLHTDMQTAINAGVTTAIAGAGDTATAIANALAPLTADVAVGALIDSATTTRNKLDNRYIPRTSGAGGNDITGWFHVDAYGAVGDATTDDRTAIQNAIDAAAAMYATSNRYVQQIVYLSPRQYKVSMSSYYLADGSQDGSVAGIIMKTGVHLTGFGQIVAMNGSSYINTHLGVIRSPSNGIRDATISNITVDGNVANQYPSQQCNNIEILAIKNVEIANTRQYSANGVGIMVTGIHSGLVGKNIRIHHNVVDSCTNIGIQSSQFDGLDIDNNTVSNCVNNGIDIYGENGSNSSTGTNWRITNNRVDHCLSGIFPETVSYGLVANNVLANNTESGIHVNRINGAPTGVVLMGNQCHDNPAGIRITGDMFPGSVIIRGNTIMGSSGAGIDLGGGGASLSGINIDGNYIDSTTPNTVPLIRVQSGTNVWSNSRIRRTMTQNTNRSYDVLNYATTTASSVSYDQANS